MNFFSCETEKVYAKILRITELDASYGGSDFVVAIGKNKLWVNTNDGIVTEESKIKNLINRTMLTKLKRIHKLTMKPEENISKCYQ